MWWWPRSMRHISPGHNVVRLISTHCEGTLFDIMIPYHRLTVRLIKIIYYTQEVVKFTKSLHVFSVFPVGVLPSGTIYKLGWGPLHLVHYLLCQGWLIFCKSIWKSIKSHSYLTNLYPYTPGRVLTIWRLLHMLRHFNPTFSGLWKLCIVSTPVFEQKWGKCIVSPIFSQKSAKYIISITILGPL